MIRVHTIISGGQTGADRGAIDAAIILGLKRGGMAPAGWRAEDGEIPLKYRVGMMQSASAAYPVRTRANVEASGGTCIVTLDKYMREGSGTEATWKLCHQLRKPRFWIRCAATLSAIDIDKARIWIEEHDIRTLNVAGPRESREPGIQAATCAALIAILGAPDDGGFGGGG